MRRSWLILAVVVTVVAAGLGALLWLRAEGAPPAPPPPESPPLALPDFQPVEVQAGPGQGLSLRGTVQDAAGRPVPGAEVFLAASAQSSLASVTCPEDRLALLACGSPESARAVHGLLEGGQGALVPGARTTADGEGRFRFEGLSGVSFTVWAQSPSHGAALRERAAPGEPVELFLPPLRSLVGRVLDARGEGVGGARVWAVSRRLPLYREARAGADGRFEVTGLGEGPFYVLASAPGLLPASSPLVEAGPRPVELVLPAPRALEVEVVRRGAPVDATVRLESDHLHRALPTEGGRVRFESLYPRELVVVAEAAGLASLPRTLSLEEPLTRVRLELEEAGRLLVTVVDEAGMPVPTPTLRLWTQAGERVAEKRADTGELVIFGPLAVGDVQLEAEAEGFKKALLPVRIRPGEVQLEVPLARGTVIAGRVMDVYGRPAPNISVLVQPTGDVVYADTEGHFSALVPTPGVYTLHAHHSDWGGAEKQVTAPDEQVELSLEPKASVSVVAQSSGRRLEGASATLFVDQATVFRSDRTSGPDGVVPMKGMPAGSYFVVATHPDHLPSQPTRVTVEDGQTQEVVVELQPGVTLEGEVVDEQGAPIAGARLFSRPRSAEQALSDAQGRFTLRGLRPERQVLVEAYHEEFDQQGPLRATPGGEPVRVTMVRRQRYSGRVVSEDGEPVRRFRVNDHDVVASDGRFELPLGGRAQGGDEQFYLSVEAQGFEPKVLEGARPGELGDIVLTKSPLLGGQVVDPGGAPVADAVVTCDVCDESVLSGQDGSFSLSSPAILSRLTVTARKGTQTARVEVGKGRERVTLTLQRAARLTGLVSGADGRPAPGAVVEAVGLDQAEPQVAVTGPDGRFSLEVAPGDYRMAQGLEGGFGGGPLVLVSVGEGGAEVNLGPGPGTASLAVRVSPERGRGLWVVRGEVGTVANPPRDLMRVPYGQLVFQPRTDRVVFQGLPPGRYTVVWGSFHSQGPAPRTRVVDLPGDGEVDFVTGG